ncbi:unnamed protein product [Urochloa humidicola]
MQSSVLLRLQAIANRRWCAAHFLSTARIIPFSCAEKFASACFVAPRSNSISPRPRSTPPVWHAIASSASCAISLLRAVLQAPAQALSPVGRPHLICCLKRKKHAAAVEEVVVSPVVGNATATTIAIKRSREETDLKGASGRARGDSTSPRRFLSRLHRRHHDAAVAVAQCNSV